MNLQEFQTLVEIQAPPGLKGHPFLRAAIYETVTGEGRLARSLVPKVIQRAGELAAEFALPEGTTQGPVPTPRDFMAGEMLAETITPWVRELREAGFRGSGAPFEIEAEAAAWIERTAAAADLEERRAGRNTEGDLAKRREIDRLAHELGLNVSRTDPELSYWRPEEDHLRTVYVVPGSFLGRLARETNRLCHYTGCPASVLVMHVLTGLKPVIPRIKMIRHNASTRLTGGKYLRRIWETVEFNAADLTYEEVRWAYSDVREHVGGKGTKGLTFEDMDFRRLVKDMGGPPETHGQKRRFWEQVRCRWNREYAQEKGYTYYKTWEGIKKKYFSLRERLGELTPP